MTINVSSFVAMSKEQAKERKSLTVRNSEKRTKEIKEQLSGAVTARNSTVKTLRELHDITTERDQLKIGLERTKRALAAIRKKCEDVGKIKEAYDKLKERSGLLQEPPFVV
ncbi:unnamed protein product [Peronospora destructor]|uniref:Uncharacterized protein n=1 Tax=Peronospora destructor TaxID=86335 RepID=A0AAV0V701_9STRA|nr:unnamed protein product [Peronospora destructor]